jgi:hemolysin activation/secretion protein
MLRLPTLVMRVALLMCGLVSVCARAQVVGQPPNPQQPSSPGYRSPTVPAQPDYHLPPLPPPATTSPQSPGGGQMFIKHIEVRGVTVFKPATIAAFVKPYEGRTVSAGELQSLRIALTRLYTDKGYINSGVIIPDQHSEDGVVVFQAMEGKLTRVRVGGTTHLSSHYVASRIKTRAGDPLNVTDVQNALRYLQQDPNVSRLDARLGPGDALGESVLQVNVSDQPRFKAGIGGDNYQSSSIGAAEGRIYFGARNLTGYGEDFNASVSRSRGNTLGSAVLSAPLNARDGMLQLFYSRGDAAIIEQPFKALDIKETVRTYGLTFTQPIVDRLNDRFALFIGAESDRAVTELLGSGFSFSPGAQNGVSATAVLLGGLDWLLHGSRSVTDLRLTYRHGFKALGATINTPASGTDLFNPNPTGADGRFGLEQLQFVHIERLNGFKALARLNDRAELIARVEAQYSQNPLLSLEKFTVGGIDTVRGVPENLFVRDNGVAATVELQLPIPGYHPGPHPLDLVLAPFIDYGRSWDKANEDPGNPLHDTTVARTIATAGIGMLWSPLQGLAAQVYWGRSIANNLGNDDPRPYLPHDLQFYGVYFSVNYVVRW